jgi:hypothetical protein
MAWRCLTGYCWAAVRRTKRAVSPELMRFHRQEQMKKLKAIFRAILGLKRLDNFFLVTEHNKVLIQSTAAERKTMME